jgi:tetratricopeptide (TPR) repeat protein
MKISSWQKIIFILFGIFLTLLFLEIGLRLGELTLLQIQEHRNRLALKQRGYRIMCLGESTTQGQYPLFLDEILNKANLGIKFSVIDKGVSGTNTSVMVSQLEENIKKYNPDMVVAMIGINDSGIPIPVKFNRSPRFFLTSLKVYKLGQLILIHLRNKIERFKGDKLCHGVLVSLSKNIDKFFLSNVIAGDVRLDVKPEINTDVKAESDIYYFKLGKELSAQGELELAKQAYRKAIKLNPYNNIEAYFCLAWLSPNTAESKAIFKKVFQYYKKLIAVDGVNDILNLCSFCEVFVDGDETQMYLKELEGLLKKILARDPKNSSAASSLVYMFLKQRRYSEAEEVLKSSSKLHNDRNAQLFDYFAVLYHNTGRSALSEHCLVEARKLRSQCYSELTINNYKQIKAILDAHKIKLVCVQYPLRSIENLKEIFYGENNVIFVDNESIFKNALKKLSYEDLFRDLFAGDFGHCTKKGNRLLAENIANVILKQVLK